MPRPLSFAIVAELWLSAFGMPAYEVSGECGAVGPVASQAPKKS